MDLSPEIVSPSPIVVADGATPDDAEYQEAPADALEPYRRWAIVLFTLLVLVTVVGLVGSLSAAPSPPGYWVLAASVGLIIATYLAVVDALRRGVPWAVHAIAPICYVLVVAALIRVITALGQNAITVPLDGIGALMVLTRDHRAAILPPVDRGGSWRMSIAVGLVALAQVLPYASGYIASGGLLGAQPDSLDLRIAVDCSSAGPPGAEIPVRTTWSWRGGEVFSPAVDGLLIRWFMSTDGTGEATSRATVGGPVTLSDPAIWAGSGSPAATLIQPLTMEQPSRDFAIDVGTAGLIDGSVELGILPADQTARHGSLTAWATYAHGDRWLLDSDSVDCSW
jgi:hypothetical protein